MENIHPYLSQLLQATQRTAEEEAWLRNYLETTDAQELRQAMERDFQYDLETRIKIDAGTSALLWVRIQRNRRPRVAIPLLPRNRPWRYTILRYSVAAAILILVGTIAYRWLLNPVTQTNGENLAISNSLIPGVNKATLTLADGSVVILDSNSQVIRQGSTTIQQSDKSLFYNGQSATDLEYNTLTTPIGTHFHVVLSDGTKVWLNAASSLKYPTAFLGTTRTVEATGEVYFEVARNTAKPFKVKLRKDTEIEVLGTSFNVNAYEDEVGIHTTLLEGSIRTSIITPYSSKESVLLQPGEQAIITSAINQKSKPVITVAKLENASKIIAWKNGYFSFKHADVTTVMRQLKNWYPIEIVYKGALTTRKFAGEINRDLTLEQVVSILNSSKIYCKLIDNKLIVGTES